jgi:MFS family permease
MKRVNELSASSFDPAESVESPALLGAAGGLSRGSRSGVHLVPLAAATGVYAFVQNIVVPALPSFGPAFGVGPGTAQLLFALFFVSASLSLSVAGRLERAWGTQRAFRVVMVVATAGGIVAAFAPDFTVLVIGRTAQGLLGAALPLAIASVRHHSTGRVASRQIGVLSGSLGLGGIAGVLLAGWLISTWGFRSALIAAAVVQLITCIMIWNERGAPPRVGEQRSAFSLVIGCVVLTCGILAADISGSGSTALTVRLALAGVAVAGIVTYLVAVRRPGVQRISSFAVGTLAVSGLAGITMFSVFTLLPYSNSEIEASLGLAGLNLGIYLGGAGAGMLSRGTALRAQLAASGSITLVGLAFCVFEHGVIALFVIGLCIVGIGVGALLTLPVIARVNISASVESAEISGQLTIAKNVGSVVAGQVFVTVLALSASAIPGGISLAGANTVYTIAAAATVLCIACSLTLTTARSTVPRSAVPEGGLL